MYMRISANFSIFLMNLDSKTIIKLSSNAILSTAKICTQYYIHLILGESLASWGANGFLKNLVSECID